MKNKIITLILLAGAVAVSSCGIDELTDMAKNPVHVRGGIDPNFGVPLANGQVRIDELLGMLGTSGLGLDDYINQDSNTITIKFFYELSDSIAAGSMAIGDISTSLPPQRMKPSVATKTELISTDTVISYPLDITFFDNIDIEGVTPGNLAINHLWLSFDASVRGSCPESIRDKIANYVGATLDSVVIKYTTKNGTTNIYDDPSVTNISISTGNILESEELHLDNIDLAEIIDSMPTHIDMSFRIRFSVDENIYGTGISDILHFQELLDSIGLTMLYYTGSVNVEMPLEISIGSLPFTFPINMSSETRMDINQKLDSIAKGFDIELKNSHLYLGLENHMPLDLTISAKLIDDNGDTLGDNLFSGKILGAPIDFEGNVIGVADTTLAATVNSQVLDDFSKASKLEVKLNLGTSRDNAGNPSFVRIRKDDYLKIKFYANLHAGVSADIIIKD